MSDPILTDEELKEREKKAFGANDPFEVAAMTFTSQGPIFEKITKKMSTSELRRLVNALVQHPLNTKEYIYEDEASPDLKEAYNIGQGMMDAKILIALSTMLSNSEEEMKKKEENNG